MKKVVFIINSAQNQRCIKRVNEFVSNGYEVAAYAFTRGEELHNKPNFELKIIGRFTNDAPYKDRITLMYKSIRSVIQTYKNEDVIYYLFSLDVALLFKLQSRNKYIYEESDLVHTYIRNKHVKKLLEVIDKRIIRQSLLTVFTSEGFVRFHYGDKKIPNGMVVPNRLTPEIVNYPVAEKKKVDATRLSIGFVGAVRFRSLYNFAETILQTFPNHEFHFYGSINSNRDGDFQSLDKYPNCFFHGAFKNPQDLPHIYSQIDLLVSTYDLVEENVKYAEPNKLYESIYFETPIIVTSGTYLAEKVKELGIGYDVNAMDSDEVVKFVENLNESDIKQKVFNCRKIDKTTTLNINDTLFKNLQSVRKS